MKSIPNFNVEDKDLGIQNGYRYAEAALGDVVADGDRNGFTAFFKDNVHIVHSSAVDQIVGVVKKAYSSALTMINNYKNE